MVLDIIFHFEDLQQFSMFLRFSSANPIQKLFGEIVALNLSWLHSGFPVFRASASFALLLEVLDSTINSI